jgi:hypothetical protein
MKVYKLVRVVGERFFSCIPSDDELEYSLGQVLYPEIDHSAIFCFDCESSATAFLLGVLYSGPYAILECAGSNFWCSTKELRATWATDRRVFWKEMFEYPGGRLQDRPSATSTLPHGTVLCSSVKPRKIVRQIVMR